jgi:hypothetical protein
MKLTTAEYDGLLSRFCASSVKRQCISFGDDPLNHPDHETVESESVSGANAIVQSHMLGPLDIVIHFEYHLVLEAGEWRIVSRVYAAEDGKYECL